MEPERWARIEELYHRAASLPPAERDRLIASECPGDQDLREQVMSLLEEDPAGDTFLSEPALAIAARLIADEIPVLTGRTLGPYVVQDLLGSGGMGDVYRGYDTVLGRAVALKMLPEAFHDDLARLKQFAQEAKFLASLTHPNIAAIYGLHEEDGIRALVLELVEGETLEDRLARGPLPLYDTVRIARQIGDALDCAHQRNVVHRDLKPSNIKVLPDGTAKLLDFGIATSLAGDTPHDDRHVIGTSVYMSPEQARGDAVDRRTDIWAFGYVLFEMLAGVRAATRTGVAAGGPDWSLLPSTVPAPMVALLKRCLEEDPRRRRRDIGDVLVDLDEALGETESAGAASSPSEVEASWRRPPVVIASGLALAIATFLAGWQVNRIGDPATRSAFPTWHKLTFEHGYVHSARFGPGGATVLYSASWQGEPFRVFTTTTQRPESQALDLPPAGLLAVSPEGELSLSLGCGYRPLNGSCLGTLARAPLLGGAPRKIAEQVQAADWGPRDAIAAVVGDALEFPLGTRLADRAGLVRVSPDGQRLLSSEPERHSGLAIVVRHGQQRQVLSRGWTYISGLAWTVDGKAALVTGIGPNSFDDVVVRVELDGRARAVLRAGPRIRVLDAAAPDRLLIDHSTDTRHTWIHDSAAAGGRRNVSWLGSSTVEAMADDGGMILITVRVGPTLEAGRPLTSRYPIYVRPTDGGPAAFLGYGFGRALSPDGRWALTVAPHEPDRVGASLVLHPLGTGAPSTLDGRGVFLGHRALNASFAGPDRILFDATRGETETALETFTQSIHGGAPVRLAHEPGQVVSPVAPDGERFISRRSDRSLWLATVAPGPSRRLPMTLQSNQIVRQWSADGRHVFVVTLLEDRWVVTRVEVATGSAQAHAEVMRDPLAERPGMNLRISRDGRMIVFSDTRILSALFLIEGAR
jgi:serine/threonine protein kinase